MSFQPKLLISGFMKNKIRNMNTFYQEEPYLSQGIRYFSEGKYSVFYKIIDDTAYVIRIINGTRDIPTALTE